MQLRVLIADDEPSARERLRQLLEEEKDIQIVGECENGLEAVQSIKAFEPDLVFLDVRMPELDGFEVLHALIPGRLPSVVFVTAHDRYAIQAFNVCAVDYLLKPFDRSRFQKSLLLARDTVARNRADPDSRNIRDLLARLGSVPKVVERLAVKSAGKILLVTFDEIDWIKGARNYAELHVGRKVHLLRQTLNSLEQRLPANQFVRISKSLIVKASCVVELQSKAHGDCHVIMRDGTRLPATRNFRENLRRVLRY